MEVLKSKMLNKIYSDKLKSFTTNDFLDLANYKAISKTLQRMEQNNEIKRVIRGTYYIPNINKTFNICEPPDIDGVAHTIARKFNWNICPSGNYALNKLGLSTQVPAQYCYASDGPNKTFSIGATTIKFKHSNKREIADFSSATLLVIQAMKGIGRQNLTKKDFETIKSKISKKDYQILLSETQKSNIWIYESVKKLGELYV